MLHSARASRTCTWGCCGPSPTSRTLRSREKRQVARQVRDERNTPTDTWRQP